MIKNKKYNRKHLIKLFSVVLLISCILIESFTLDIYADELSTKTAKNLDVVLVMDKSTSMDKSDPDKTSIESAKMFIDMLKKTGSNVSIIEFSNESKVNSMIDVKDKQSKEQLKSILEGIQFLGSATDTGDALLKAVDVLENNGNDENKKSIILFSDGKTAIKRNDRTEEDSKKDIEKSIEICKDSNFSIYSVGLINENDSESDKQEFQRQMQNIANQTDGQYIKADNVDDLPEFFSQLLQTLDGIKGVDLGTITSNGDYQTVTLDITNPNILEANVLLLHNKDIKDIKLINPDKKEVDLNSSDIVYTNSSKYSLIKMLNPQKGKWQMKIKGASKDNIKLSLVYNYNLELVSTLSKKSISKGQKVNINAYFNYENKHLKDKEFYGLLNTTAIVRNSKNNKEKKIKLNFSENGYSKEITLDEYGDYYIVINAKGEGIDKYSSEMHLTCKNQAPVMSNLDEEIDLNINDKKEINLNDYIKDPEKDSIEFNISNSDDNVLNSNISSGKLDLSANNEGQTVIEIIAKDSQGQSSKFNIKVNVVNPIKKILITSIATILLLVILLGIYIKNSKSKKMRGEVIVNITENNRGNYNNFSIDQPIVLRGNSKDLKSILLMAISNYSLSGERNDRELRGAIDVILNKASKVKFIATGKKKDEVNKVKLVKKPDKDIALMGMGGFADFNKKSIDIDFSNFVGDCGVKFRLNNNDEDYIEIHMEIQKEEF